MANIATIGSLFRKTKNDPEFAETQQRVRHSLLKTLSRAIKEVQVLSTECEEGGRVGDCQPTQRLCTRFENALRHGLKARWFGQSSTFWPLVLQISRKQAIEHISGLQYAVSETGRCRAWIRMAVNECSLESYIGVICQNSSLRSQHYEVHAFMRDEDVVGPLQQLLAGLSQINFNITVDTASLEYEAVPEALQPPLQLRLPKHLLDDKDVHQKKRRRRKHHKASSRSHDRHVTPIENKSHDCHVTPIEDSDGDGESSDSSSSDKEEEEEGEGRGGERKLEVFLTESEKRGDTNGGGNEPQVALMLSEGGEVGRVEDVFGERGEWEADSLGTYQTEGETSELAGVADDPQREAGGSGEREEDGDGGGEVVGAGEVQVEEDRNWMEDGISLANQIEDSHQDKNQEEFPDKVQDNRDQDNRDQDNRDQDNVTNSAQDIQQDTLLDNNYCGAAGASEMEGGDEEEEREEKDREEGTSSEVEATTVPLERREPQILESRQIPSPDSRPFAVTPNQLGTGSPLQLLPTPFNLDSIPDQTSKNPFDQLEQGLVGDHTYLRGRNPFNNSPPDKDLPTPTADSAQNGFLPTPSSQPHPTTMTNPFDSTHDTPSPSLSSPSSSDFRGKSPSLAGRQEGRGGERRVSRADSLEWSIYMEQNMVDLPGGVASSELALEEDYYSAELGIGELQEMIQRLKRDLITSSSSISPLSPVEQHALRRKIVHLQLQLQNKKEEEEESGAAYEEVSGHKFVRQPRQRRVLRDLSCLACKKRVRGLIREWHRCKACRSVCHKKCLSSVVNQCSVPGDDVEYILEMCPEVGLTDQQFRCIRCNRQLTQTLPVEVRLCDYDGRHYCPDCHANDLAVIPARVIHNWDFVPRRVCCQCSSLLLHLSSRPLLRVSSTNPLLYTHVQDLVEVERLRTDLLHMKSLLATCQLARDRQLLHQLGVFPNFKEDASLLTLHEMVEIQNGYLLTALNDIHRCFAKHITTECQTCSSRGQTCPLCSSAEPIFPFGHQVSICAHCSAIFHKDCFSEVSSCPTCHKTKT